MNSASVSFLQSTAGALFYVALMVLGWGGFDFFQSIPNLFVATTILLSPFLLAGSQMHSGNRGKEQGESRAQFVMVALLSTVGVAYFLPFFYHRQLGAFSFPDTIRFIGMPIYLAGYMIRVDAIKTLKRQFSYYVTIQENHQLITTGIYSLIRHPGYLGTLLAVSGLFLIYPSWYGLFFFVLYASSLVRRISREERLLLKYFGSVYEEYSLKSFRLIPHLY
jgi:protein-S-isoprenylcysteine O-methyltransferase Ste14